MIIKKFQGKTKEDAILLAKKELGDGIVEMNVRNVKAKGIMRFFLGSRVEVTVAMEEEGERAANSSATMVKEENGNVVTLVKPVVEETPKESEVTANFMKEMQTKREGAITKALAEKQPDLFDARLKGNQEKMNAKGDAIEEKLDNLQSLLEQQISRKDEDRAEEKVVEVKVEDSKLANFLKLLYNKMLESEIDDKYAKEIIDEIEKNNAGNNNEIALDHVLADVYQRMILKFGKADCIEPATNGPKVVFFVGPTGVGKTTTIAKIASQFRVEQHKKVALLTSDTYRIAAAEQLRTYANILEVPFRVVYTPQEVENAVKDFTDYDYILVDTTGHSQNNESQRENMSDFLNALKEVEEKEIFLVLSASTKYCDLKNIVDIYGQFTQYKLIFTKLDETLTYGSLFNLKLYSGAPLSYITCGQNVPDDIEVFNPQKTVKQLLGGRH